MVHCPQCGHYEEQVMAQVQLAPDVRPCESFQMSDAFREWAVARMRSEVMAQIQARGLDRMAMVKAKGPPSG